MTSTRPPRTSIDVDLDVDYLFEPIAADRWRVVDTRVPNESPAATVGFVCLVAGVYEVTGLARPLEVRFCHDLFAAEIAVSDLR